MPSAYPEFIEGVKRYPCYTASDGRHSGWPVVLSRQRSRRIEGRFVQNLLSEPAMFNGAAMSTMNMSRRTRAESPE